MRYGLYITLMAICLVFSATFSAAETAFTSVNRVKIKTMSGDGNKKASRVQFLIEKYDKLLSAVLIGNNIVNIALSSMATIVFTAALALTEAQEAAITTAIVTLVVLIFGEVAPKSLAKERPEQTCMFLAPFVRCVMIIFTPFCWFFSLQSKLIGKITHSRNDTDTFTEDEILTIVEEAESEGELKADESNLIRSAIEFTDRTAGEILTPRVDIVAIANTASNEELAKIIAESGYSRIPVYEGSIDNIIGIIHEKDFYAFIFNTENHFMKVAKEPVYAVESVKIGDLLKKMQAGKIHIAVINDEFGGTQGIVTVEDILEELVGEIWDETDDTEEDVVKKSDDEYQIRGDADIHCLTEVFSLDTEDFDATTVAGFVNEITGKMPKENTEVTYENLKITVSKVNRHRITEIMVKVLEKENDEEE